MVKNLHNVCTHSQEKRIRVSVIAAFVFSVQISAIKVWFGGLGKLYSCEGPKLLFLLGT